MSVNVTTKLRQARALMVAEFAFKQRLERIEWEEEVMKPALEKLALEAGENLEIPEFIVTHETDEA
jgi:hypothetical protein